MKNEIINRVANSKLVTIDLEDFYPQGKRMALDITPWLLDGLVLQERNFRDYVKKHNWQQYQGAYVAINCSSDAIVPTWAYMMIAIHLKNIAKEMSYGTLEDLESSIFNKIIDSINLDEYKNKPVIIKGCSNIEIPKNAYVRLTQKLQPIVKSIMFGEACSSVPLFKKANK
jgi:hypothetical protein